MFDGLSAFPLTPLNGDDVDDQAFIKIMGRLVEAGVDSITALGSTGSYAYLSRPERAHVARLAIEHAGTIPVVVGIGSLRTTDVLRHAADAQAAGAAGVLLAPMSYQPLTDDDVYGLYDDVTHDLDAPLIVYDNPGTTHVTFTDELYRAVAALPHVASVKIPGVPREPADAAARIHQLRTLLPPHVSIGVSGDASGATGLNAGCDSWYSVIAGTLPQPALAITRAAQADRSEEAASLSGQLHPVWELFARHGSLRVVAAIAEHLGLTAPDCLPRPIRGLHREERAAIAQTLDHLSLGN